MALLGISITLLFFVLFVISSLSETERVQVRVCREVREADADLQIEESLGL